MIAGLGVGYHNYLSAVLQRTLTNRQRSSALMAENGQDAEGYRGGPQPERTSEEHDKQALLLKLAERTVLQAEALAQEITNRAREQSEA